MPIFSLRGAARFHECQKGSRKANFARVDVKTGFLTQKSKENNGVRKRPEPAVIFAARAENMRTHAKFPKITAGFFDF